MSKMEVQAWFELSSSTIDRITSQFDPSRNKTKFKFSKYGNRIAESSVVQQSIIEFLIENRGPFTSKDIKKAIMKKFGVKVDESRIRHILKTTHRLSYKKGSARPCSINYPRLTEIRRLFAILITNKLAKFQLLVNVDEWCISRNTRQNYSWIEKGRAGSINSIVFAGAWSIVASITSRGDWIAWFYN